MDGDAMRGWLDARAASGEFSGSVLVSRRGEALFSYSAGLAHRGHGVQIRDDTRFASASITKLPVAVTALRLVGRGELDLHRPLVEILPPEHRPIALTRDHTLHHLLSHTSGLASYFDDGDPTWASFTAAWDRIPVYHLRKPADLLPLFADLPAVRPPGEAYEYCDANFVLVGLVLEAVTGEAWATTVEREVFAPTGLSDTAVEAMDDEPDRLATGYRTDDGPSGRPRSNIYSVTATGMPDGGMLTTTADLARLMDALIGGRLLPPDLLAAMTSPQGPASDDVEQYGYGCSLAVRDGRVVVIGHGGSDPGVAAMLSHYLEAGLTIAVLCNQDRGAYPATLELARVFELDDPRAD